MFPKIDYPQNRGFSKLKVRRKHYLNVECVDYILDRKFCLQAIKKLLIQFIPKTLCRSNLGMDLRMDYGYSFMDRSNLGMDYGYSGVKI